MYNILIVDDDENIRKLVAKYGAYEGYTVSEAENGLCAVEMCTVNSYDIIVMDVMMPELDGFSACREILKNERVPIIMLSARGEEYDRIHGFELGIDDYVVKPFSPKELMMRIAAIMKRRDGEDATAHRTYAHKGLLVDFSARTVSIDGELRELSPKEYELLSYMIKNKGLALSRDTLLNKVWGFNFFKDGRTLDTHIKLLRKSLGNYSSCIVTLHGVGYRFEEK